jgi:hypothetical protein
MFGKKHTAERLVAIQFELDPSIYGDTSGRDTISRISKLDNLFALRRFVAASALSDLRSTDIDIQLVLRDIG